MRNASSRPSSPTTPPASPELRRRLARLVRTGSPGVVARALYPEIRGSAADQAYPVLVTRLLPLGLKGVVMAAMLAALMSSLASVFNSCSTLVTWDVYRKLRPQASESRLVLVGRAATVVLVVLGLLWIPFMRYISSSLYLYLQSVQAYIAPPIAGCFLLGLFMPRLNGIEARVQQLVDQFMAPGLEAGERSGLGLEAALPLAHGGNEQRRHRMGRAGRQRLIEFLQRLA